LSQKCSVTAHIFLNGSIRPILALMNTPRLVLTLLFGAFMVVGGINHFLKPGMYFPFIPGFLPKEAINLLAGVAEIILGIGVFLPRFRFASAWGILLLMFIFLPLHIWDVFSDRPAIGSHDAALIRLPLQLLFILWAWYISRKPVAKG
jgi:uncharacterized membrane protein